MGGGRSRQCFLTALRETRHRLFKASPSRSTFSNVTTVANRKRLSSARNIEVDSLLHQVPVADTNVMSLSSIAALSTLGFPDTSTHRFLAVLTLLIVSLRISARVSALSLGLFDLLEHHWDQVMGICLAEF